MDRNAAENDIGFIRRIIERAGERIDPHLFHVVHWGAIVLVWYPLSNWFEATGRRGLLLPLGIGALLLGSALSGIHEARLRGRPRVEGTNPHVERQVMLAIFGPLAIGVALSALGPATGFIEGPRIPSVWGLTYAVMAYTIGIVYSREWLWAGLFIFLGTIASIVFHPFAGYILGPVMGLGMIVPGLAAERRVRRLGAEDSRGA